MERDCIETVRLFPELNARLVELVAGMKASDWETRTRFPGWKVKDILAEMIGRYQDELSDFLATLDPYAEALFPVAWAGESRSANWSDVAREYTERWHHQMQIRDALGAEPIYSRRLYYPVLDTFMRALRHHFRDFARESGKDPDTLVTIGGDRAWRIFTKWGGVSDRDLSIAGDRELGRRLLDMTCIMLS